MLIAQPLAARSTSRLLMPAARQDNCLIPSLLAMMQDTEFPGVVARPIGSFSTNTDYQYQTLRCNVDLLKIIQLGLSFFDKHGNFAEGCPTWQFNFKFNLRFNTPCSALLF